MTSTHVIIVLLSSDWFLLTVSNSAEEMEFVRSSTKFAEPLSDHCYELLLANYLSLFHLDFFLEFLFVLLFGTHFIFFILLHFLNSFYELSEIATSPRLKGVPLLVSILCVD